MEQSQIERAKRVSLPNYLEIRLGLIPQRQKGNDMFFFSPFRQEKDASLHVSFENGYWKWFDFGCPMRSSGDAISFIRAYKNCTFVEAVEELLSFEGVDVISRQPVRIRKPQRSVSIPANSKPLSKILWAVKYYNRLPGNNLNMIRKYFLERGVKYYEELACKVCIHFKDQINYIVIPLPNIRNIRGLELREICSLEKELGLEGKKERRNYGCKTLWFFRRDPSRMLLAESILDALAGEVLLNDYDMSLAALNGVGQVNQLETLIQMVRPSKVLLSMDQDAPGRETKVRAEQILIQNKIAFEVIETKSKDLFRELHSVEGKEVTKYVGNSI